MNIDTICARVEASKKIKSKIDKMNLGCVCDVKSVGEDEVTLILSFRNSDCDPDRKVVTGFACS